VDIDRLVAESHRIAKEHGFWDPNPTTGATPCVQQTLALINSESSEGLEADRKNRHADLAEFDATDEAIDYKYRFETYIKDTYEDELADTCIRIFDLCGQREIEFDLIPVTIKATCVAEEILRIQQLICMAELMPEVLLPVAVSYVFMVAVKRNIDIKRHIELKMAYNERRGYKHGKQY